MKWNLYDDSLNTWGEVIIKPVLDIHKDTIGNENEAGHFKIDGETLKVNEDGVLKVDDSLRSNGVNRIVYNIGSSVKQGRLMDTHFPLDFNAKLLKLEFSMIQASTSPIEINIDKTTNFTNYEKVLNNNLVVESNSNFKTFEVNEDVIFNSGDKLFINFESTIDDGYNAVIILTVEKI